MMVYFFYALKHRYSEYLFWSFPFSCPISLRRFQ